MIHAQPHPKEFENQREKLDLPLFDPQLIPGAF